ncbi:hypothetical protein MOX02_60640 [Methylobacterium oxalidis]|uniref:Uncharacterized protein n=2 Tax=Methylobacterium oxalidis TaxID=944322 RepID=A0A512JDJ9_9HYPH|nr:hypothetical protein MOX02_60640 [Methylobacterium oxalidis]GLS63212.1 hypothetical protein GCM10007888_15930 [Methylobacterium oxalidis]
MRREHRAGRVVAGPVGDEARESVSMLNFLLGTVAGGLIACIATIAAARHPDVQARLGLTAPPSTAMTAAAITRPEVPCRPQGAPAQTVGDPEMLFSKRRFWSVAP